MYTSRILVICIVLIVICAAQDTELLNRPIRPEKFGSHEELQDYLQRLKAYHLQNGHSRYGKRFSPPEPMRLRTQVVPAHYWQNIYDIVKNYEDN